MKKSVFTLVIAGAVFIGYLSGCKRNELPVIESLVSENSEDTLVVAGDTVKVICTATDADENELFYTWDASGGGFTESEDGTEITWVAPNQSGIYNIVCKVTDLEEDTVNFVSDTFAVDVQNYFPMVKDSWWYYDGFYYVVENFPNTIKRKVYSKEELGDNEIQWHIETTDSVTTGTVIDSSDYFSVKDGSVFESMLFYHRVFEILRTQGTICEMPLWEGKTWLYNQDKTATVIELRDRGTEAFSFSDCAHIEIVTDTNPTQVRTIWFAPDVGIISDQTEVDGAKRLDYELMDYDLQ
jgi:hypothetical protein